MIAIIFLALFIVACYTGSWDIALLCAIPLVGGFVIYVLENPKKE